MEDRENDSESSDDQAYSGFASSNRFAALSTTKKKPIQSTIPNSKVSKQSVAQKNSKTQQSRKTTSFAGATGDQSLASGNSKTKENSSEFWGATSKVGTGTPFAPLDYPPLLREYDFYVACEFCFNAPNNNVKMLAHRCNYSLLSCRARIDEVAPEEVEDGDHDFRRRLDWSLVRQFTGSKQLRLCSGRRQCLQGTRCEMAHSEVELEIWTRQHSGDIERLTAAFKDSLVATTITGSTKEEILPFPDGSSERVSIWLGCKDCATFVRKHYYVLRHWSHECAANVVFVRYDFQPAVQAEYWVFVRSSPPAAIRKGNFELCRHMDVGCWRGFACHFAHTRFEAYLWELDKTGRFPLDNFLEQVCRLGTPSALEWKPTTLSTIKEPVMMAEACPVRPTSISNGGGMRINETVPPRFRTGASMTLSSSSRSSSNVDLLPHVGNGHVQGTASSRISHFGNGDHSRCPFNVRMICYSCFKASGAVVLQNGSYCGSRAASHTWDQHKRMVVLDSSGKPQLLRSIPNSILRNRQSGKPYFVRLCNRLEKYKSCTFSGCDFAHGDLERKCWLWSLKTGEDLMEIAERASKVPVVTEKKAPVPVPKPIVVRPQPVKTCAATSRPSVVAVVPVAPIRSRIPSTMPMVPVANAAPPAPEPEVEEAVFYCYLCDKQLRGHDLYDEHLTSQVHQYRARLVNKRCVWKCREPPGPPPFRLCDRNLHGESCLYSKSTSNHCAFAHSLDEVEEWSERFELLRRALLEQSNEEVIELQKKIDDAKRQGKSILSSCVDDVEISCQENTRAAFIEKGKAFVWKFTVAGEKRLKRVVLLDHDSAIYFRLRSPYSVTSGEEVESGDAFADDVIDGMYEVHLEFIGNNVPQTFTQKVAFDFGDVPIVYREVVVHSGLDAAAVSKQLSLKYLLAPADGRWTAENAEIWWMSKERSAERIDVADVVANLNFDLNESNYFSLSKHWLFAEEYMRQSVLDGLRLDGVTVAALASVVDDRNERLFPTSDDKLFAEVPLKEVFTEDADAVNLLREDCRTAFVATTQVFVSASSKKRVVYEADMVNKLNFGKQGVFSDRVHLQLSHILVSRLKLRPGDKVVVDIQFNLNNKQFRRWLRGLETLQERQLAPMLFPDLLTYFSGYASGKIFDDYRAKCQGATSLLKRQHNEAQYQVMEHIILCAIDRTSWIPPLVVFGPFGTGKTRTLASAAALLIKCFERTRILICTHANTTADMYINLLLEHTGMEAGALAAILWRLHTHRESAANKMFLRYETDPQNGRQRPETLTAAKLSKIRVVLCTFDSSPKLLKVLDEDNGDGTSVAFTHIFIDEAAQALELETVLPLCLAKRTTCVVVAGDHHQIRPPVYLPQAKELNRSYLERLYCYYDKQKSATDPNSRKIRHFPSVLFNRNYRCHPAILSFLSSEFYGDPNCLIPCVQSYDDSTIKPMYFVVSESDEEIGKNASICNRGEAHKVAEQVEYLWHHWPKSWGDVSIGVAVPYVEQSFLVRDVLWKKNISTADRKVDVSRVIEMQGKEYKALVISTVRGPAQLQAAVGSTRARNLAFLQDQRLINTAMTRSKYTVIVVGNPMVLCSLGSCRDIWYRYIKTCAQQNTLLPSRISWDELDRTIMFQRAATAASQKDDVAATTTEDDLLVRQLMRKTKNENKL